MKIEFIASIGVIAADPPKSRELYVDALGLPLEASDGRRVTRGVVLQGVPSHSPARLFALTTVRLEQLESGSARTIAACHLLGELSTQG